MVHLLTLSLSLSPLTRGWFGLENTRKGKKQMRVMKVGMGFIMLKIRKPNIYKTTESEECSYNPKKRVIMECLLGKEKCKKGEREFAKRKWEEYNNKPSIKTLEEWNDKLAKAQERRDVR